MVGLLAVVGDDVEAAREQYGFLGSVQGRQTCSNVSVGLTTASVCCHKSKTAWHSSSRQRYGRVLVVLEAGSCGVVEPLGVPWELGTTGAYRGRLMEYWWVNQNQTYQFEVPGGYMWSPKANTNGARNQFYDNMTETRPGDVVFSFKDTYIKAVGIVVGRAETGTKPTEFNSVENQWGQDGWFVPVWFTELERPIRPKNHMEYLRSTLPKKYSPIQVNGNGLQSVYLAKVPPDMASVLTTLLDGQVEALLETGFVEDTLSNAEDDQHESELKGNNDIPETQKSQLIKARRGQGVFRTRVCLIEKKCRITGVSAPQHLRASHIKPWRFSSPNEKLDGNNGLLLSPHIDHLFDHGYISFEANGSLLLSPHMKNDILYAWSIDPNLNVGDFLPEQEIYLKFHRDQMFKK